MAKDWYYAKDGQQRGPFPETHVRQLAVSGQILPHDLVWHEGLTDWVAAQTIPGLVPEAAESGSGAPPPSTSAQPEGAGATAAARPHSHGTAAGPASEFPAWLAILLVVGMFGLFTLCYTWLSLWLAVLIVGGLFGLLSIGYTWRISTRYAEECGARAIDAQGRPLGRVRHPAWVLLMSYATLGIYFYYWVHATLRDCGRFAGERGRAPSDATLLIVFPPYAVYCLVFKLPTAVGRVRSTAGLADAAVVPSYGFLNPLMFLALPYLAMWYQDLLNEAWTRDAAADSAPSG